MVFCNRAKLYRYDGPTKQWKERGIGDFKILHDPVTAKYRLLQRREQVCGAVFCLIALAFSMFPSLFLCLVSHLTVVLSC